MGSYFVFACRHLSYVCQLMAFAVATRWNVHGSGVFVFILPAKIRREGVGLFSFMNRWHAGSRVVAMMAERVCLCVCVCVT